MREKKSKINAKEITTVHTKKRTVGTKNNTIAEVQEIINNKIKEKQETLRVNVSYNLLITKFRMLKTGEFNR